MRKCASTRKSALAHAYTCALAHNSCSLAALLAPPPSRFRFVEVTGLPFTPTIDMVTGVHIRTGVQMAGNVVSPSLTAAPLNQLQHAVQWGLATNCMSVISDCPQRDERKGWMGDSGLSLQPTHYNYTVGAFYTAWAANIRDSQLFKGDGHPDGSVADTTPQ